MWDEGPLAGLNVTFVWRPDNSRDAGLMFDRAFVDLDE